MLKIYILLDLVNYEKDISKLFIFCMVYKKTYSKYCFICNKCIEIYGHHYHWINFYNLYIIFNN